MTKPYWHELTEEQRQTIIRNGINAQEAIDTYAQPDWCNYPDAIGGYLGCWSLVSGFVDSEERCTDCDCYKHRLKRFTVIEGGKCT
jgi:hypothetical protein